jgi:hypothetical protein
MANAEKSRAVTNLLSTVNEVAGQGGPDAYQVNKLRKAAEMLGFRKELDAFMQESWGMTIRKSKKKAGKKKAKKTS